MLGLILCYVARKYFEIENIIIFDQFIPLIFMLCVPTDHLLSKKREENTKLTSAYAKFQDLLGLVASWNNRTINTKKATVRMDVMYAVQYDNSHRFLFSPWFHWRMYTFRTSFAIS